MLTKYMDDGQQLESNLKEKYIKAIIRRGLKDWLDFFDGVDALVKAGAAEEVTYHINYNRASAKKWVDRFTLKETQKQADVLRKKVNKQFTSLSSSSFLQSLWEGIGNEFLNHFDRFQNLLTVAYNDTIAFSLNRHDIATIFY